MLIVALLDTRELAERLGLSLSTIERMRAEESPDLPPHLRFGSSSRYHPWMVEWWLEKRVDPSIGTYEEWRKENGQQLILNEISCAEQRARAFRGNSKRSVPHSS